MSQKNPPNDPVDKPMPVPPTGHQAHGEALVDEAVAETLPASDPISPYSEKQSRPVALEKPARGGTPVESAPAWNGWTRAEDAPRAQSGTADDDHARPGGRSERNERSGAGGHDEH